MKLESPCSLSSCDRRQYRAVIFSLSGTAEDCLVVTSVFIMVTAFPTAFKRVVYLSLPVPEKSSVSGCSLYWLCIFDYCHVFGFVFNHFSYFVIGCFFSGFTGYLLDDVGNATDVSLGDVLRFSIHPLYLLPFRFFAECPPQNKGQGRSLS